MKQKFFISQPMAGRSSADIETERRRIAAGMTLLFSDVELIDSYFEDIPDHQKNKSVYCLGRSIQLLSEADAVVFAPGWAHARGCVIEHEVAQKYGIRCFYLE